MNLKLVVGNLVAWIRSLEAKLSLDVHSKTPLAAEACRDFPNGVKFFDFLYKLGFTVAVLVSVR